MTDKQHSRWLVLLVILTAPLLYVIDIFIINIAIPTIQQNLHATQGEMQLVIAGYLLGSACFLIIGGRAGDYLAGRRSFSGDVCLHCNFLHLRSGPVDVAIEHRTVPAGRQLRLYGNAIHRPDPGTFP